MKYLQYTMFGQDYKYVAFTVYNVPNTVYLTRNYNFQQCVLEKG